MLKFWASGMAQNSHVNLDFDREKQTNKGLQRGHRAPHFMLLGLPNHMLRHARSGRVFRGEILIQWMPRSHQDIKALVRQAQLGHFHLADKAKGGRVAKIAHFDRFIVREDRSWESGVLVATCLCKREKSHTLNTSSQVLRMWWINCFTQKKKRAYRTACWPDPKWLWMFATLCLGLSSSYCFSPACRVEPLISATPKVCSFSEKDLTNLKRTQPIGTLSRSHRRRTKRSEKTSVKKKQVIKTRSSTSQNSYNMYLESRVVGRTQGANASWQVITVKAPQLLSWPLIPSQCNKATLAALSVRLAPLHHRPQTCHTPKTKQMHDFISKVLISKQW